MRLRRALRIVTWSGGGLAFAIILFWEKEGGPFLPSLFFITLAAHFGIEAVALLARASLRRRMADLGEFRGHRAFSIADLVASLSVDPEMDGIAIPAILEGRVAKGEEEPRKAPLSGKPAQAWRLEAELLEGLFQIPGPTLLADSFWGSIGLEDDTGRAIVEGPGLLDTAACLEKVYALERLHKDLPTLAPLIEDGLGLTSKKEASASRILVREIALRSGEEVRVFGQASRREEGLVLGGSEALDDTGSLLLRALSKPASDRLPRRMGSALVLTAATLIAATFAGLAGWGAARVALFGPGAAFDATRTGGIVVDLDGRELRISLDGQVWDFDAGDKRQEVALQSGDLDHKASRDSKLVLSSIATTTRVLRNGEAGYPRWDGQAWLLDLGATDRGGREARGGRAGRLFFRNLSPEALTIRVLDAEGAPRFPTSWTFGALEGAEGPEGKWLNLTEGGAAIVQASDSLEIITKVGARRVLSIGSEGQALPVGGFLISAVPELLAGEGKLYVSNSAEGRRRLWILGAGDLPLHGMSPWTFDPGEGRDQDRGLALSSDKVEISFSGRESLRLGEVSAKTLFSGKLEEAATWAQGRWSLRVSSFGVADSKSAPE